MFWSDLSVKILDGEERYEDKNFLLPHPANQHSCTADVMNVQLVLPECTTIAMAPKKP